MGRPQSIQPPGNHKQGITPTLHLVIYPLCQMGMGPLPRVSSREVKLMEMVKSRLHSSPLSCMCWGGVGVGRGGMVQFGMPGRLTQALGMKCSVSAHNIKPICGGLVRNNSVFPVNF